MNQADDSARLRLAIRAFQAVRPSDHEVELGVRRALTAMRRSRPRRKPRMSLTVVVAIVAFATLSYAKPSQIVALFGNLFGSGVAEPSEAPRRGGHWGAPSTADSVAAVPALPVPPGQGAEPGAGPSEPLAAGGNEPPTATAPSAAESQAAGARGVSSPAPGSAVARDGSGAVRSASAVAARGPGSLAASSSHLPSATPKPSADASAKLEKRATWAEVNAALAQDDTHSALRALRDLAAHGDAATRAKAELGIAQLGFARGDRVKACSVARSLTSRPGLERRIHERAQALLRECMR